MKTFLNTCCVLMLAISGAAQSAKDDFMKINQAYATYTNLSFSVEYSVFETYQALAPIDHQYGVYKRKGDSYYNQLMGFENLVNGKEKIVVDSASKEVYVDKVRKQSDVPQVAPVDFEKSFSLYKNIQAIQKGKGERGYSMEYKDKAISEYNKVEVYFSTETYLITRMVFYYRSKHDFSGTYPMKKGESPKIDIRFHRIDTAPKYSEDEFSASRFVTGKSGNRKASGKYKGFKVIEQN